MRKAIFGLVFMAALACLPWLLVSCDGSGGDGGDHGQEWGDNPHLLHGEDFIADESLWTRSYHTVAVRPEHHEMLSRQSGFLTLPYEVLRAGDYKFCVPEDQTHEVTLNDSVGAVIGRWHAGSCEPVSLEPDKYWLHVEGAGEDMIFINPLDATVTPVDGLDAVEASRAARRDADPGDDDLFSLKKDTLGELLGQTTDDQDGCTTDEAWVVSADGTSHNRGQGYPEIPWFMAGSGVSLSATMDPTQFFRICRDGSSASNIPIVRIFLGTEPWRGSLNWRLYPAKIHGCPGFPVSCMDWEELRRGTSDYEDPDYEYGNPDYYFSFWDEDGVFKLAPSDASEDDSTFLAWFHRWQGDYGYWFDRPWMLSTTKPESIRLDPIVRHGKITNAYLLPFLLANEVALFNQAYDKTTKSFPLGTTYWIIKDSLADLDTLAFDSPLNRVKAVIVGRGVRAHLFALPDFQPAETMEPVSPPMDAELLRNAPDSPLLARGRIGSIFIEPNTNTFTDYEFSKHAILSSGTCVECDLRGFDGSGANLEKSILTDSNLTSANLSGADLADAHLEGCRLTRVNMENAVLTRAFLRGASMNQAELSGADLASAYLEAGDYTPPGRTWNKTYARASLAGARMHNTKLNGAHAKEVDFTNASWWGDDATAEGAMLDKAHFHMADLPGLNLRGAILEGAIFSHALLLNADLSGNDDNDRSFVNTDFSYANLKGATLTGVDLRNANLENAFISWSDGTAYIEVLGDVLGDRPRYSYLSMRFGPTLGPVSTDGSTVCPNRELGWCGDIDDPDGQMFRWVSPAEPEEPADCVVQPDGTIQCESKRHPK